MAARRFVRLLRTAQNNVGVRFISQQRTSSNRSVAALVTAVAGGGAIYAYNAWIRHQHVVPVVHARHQVQEAEVSASVTVDFCFRLHSLRVSDLFSTFRGAMTATT